MDGVLNWLWQGGVVAAVLIAMLRLLARARANVRYVVCWAALLLILALPALPWLNADAAWPGVGDASAGDPMVTLPDAWWTSGVLLLVAWSAWAGIYAARFVWSIVAIRRARADARPVPSAIESRLPHWIRVRGEGRRAAVVLSDSVRTAAVLGCGAPVIAVSPSLVDTLDADELDRVLIHEWAHVQRRDDIVNVVQVLLRVVAGWHPGVWCIDRCLHVEREIACDERTVEITNAPKSYAECLLKLSTFRGSHRTALTAPAVFTTSGLGARITKIVSPPQSIAAIWSGGIAAAIVSTLALTAIGVGGLKLVESTALALPFESMPTRAAAIDALALIAAPTLPSRRPVVSIPRAPVAAASSQQSPSRRSSAPAPAKPDPEPIVPPAVVNDPAPASPAADERPDRAAGREPPPLVAPTAPQPSAATEEQSRSPWGAAADSGTALGRKSKDAGVATAGFFTRFARRVAGTF
jgi:beta-lactamase regulating signal transducer with metallopeptidase domain